MAQVGWGTCSAVEAPAYLPGPVAEVPAQLHVWRCCLAAQNPLFTWYCLPLNPTAADLLRQQRAMYCLQHSQLLRCPEKPRSPVTVAAHLCQCSSSSLALCNLQQTRLHRKVLKHSTLTKPDLSMQLVGTSNKTAMTLGLCVLKRSLTENCSLLAPTGGDP